MLLYSIRPTIPHKKVLTTLDITNLRILSQVGALAQTKFSRPCLDLNLKPTNVERAHHYCATQPSTVNTDIKLT